jgi:hypothetical protein
LLASKQEDVFNTLTDKVTNKKYINVKSEALKAFKESQITDQSTKQGSEESLDPKGKNKADA